VMQSSFPVISAEVFKGKCNGVCSLFKMI
jgi:hypothetical protein